MVMVNYWAERTNVERKLCTHSVVMHLLQFGVDLHSMLLVLVYSQGC